MREATMHASGLQVLLWNAAEMIMKSLMEIKVNSMKNYFHKAGTLFSVADVVQSK